MYRFDTTTQWFFAVVCITAIFILVFLRWLPKEKKVRWKTEDSVGNHLKDILPEYVFRKVRPYWLKSPYTQKNLELDFYCDELKVAVEYDGAQHYKYNEFFHSKNPVKFIKQRQRDAFKTKRCKELGIKLIRIPYTMEKCNFHNFLVEQLWDVLHNAS